MDLSLRRYYKIGEVCDSFNLKDYKLRDWENKFKQLSSIKRNKRRFYQARDIAIALLIQDYLKKYRIEIAIKEINELEKSPHFDKTLQSLLTKHTCKSEQTKRETNTEAKLFLQEIKELIAFLDRSITQAL